jgi:hypothetical protein
MSSRNQIISALSGGAITYLGYQANAISSSLTVVVNKPTPVKENDLMIAFMKETSTIGTWTGDTSWTELVDQGAAPNIRVAYKVAGASEGASYTFTYTYSGVLSVILVAFRGAAIDATGSLATVDPTTVVMPSITVTANSSVLLANVSTMGGAVPTTPTGLVALYSGTSYPCLYYQMVQSGATGDKSSTVGGNSSGLLVSVKPS